MVRNLLQKANKINNRKYEFKASKNNTGRG